MKNNNILSTKSSKLIITPSFKVELSGYNGRNETFEDIDTPLEINIILLESIIFVCIDTLYIPNTLKKSIVSALNIEEKELFIFATHTHFAPAVDKTKPSLGKVDDRYLNYLFNILTTNIKKLLNDDKQYKKTEVYYGYSYAYHSINRRLKLNDTVYLRPNYNGDKNEKIQSIIFKFNNKIKAVIVNYTCHPTSSVNKNNVSADYIYYLRKSIRKNFNDDNLPILFMQGFSGDIRPCCIDINANKFQNFTQNEYVNWVSSLSNCTLSSIRYSKKITNLTIKNNYKKLPYDKIIKSNSYYDDILIHHIKIGSLLLIGVSAEVVNYYDKFLKQKYKDNIVFPVSCTNGMFGYIPTDKMIEEGGYESNDFFRVFGIEAKFKKDIQKYFERYL